MEWIRDIGIKNVTPNWWWLVGILFIGLFFTALIRSGRKAK
jgi:hypothetical protein